METRQPPADVAADAAAAAEVAVQKSTVVDLRYIVLLVK